jgi:hypothetical protein
MSYSNGIISAPISFSDVQHVLGVSDTDLATLCKENTINKWSFYKPVDNLRLFNLEDVHYYAADDGFVFPAFTTAPALLQAKIAGTALWAYRKPSGGTASPYRLTDFKGYNHNSANPYIFSLGESTINSDGTIDLTCTGDLSKMLQYCTFSSYAPSSLYAGILIYNSSSPNNCYYFPLTDVKTLSDIDWSDVSISNATIQAIITKLGYGNIYIVPVLTTTHYTKADGTLYYLDVNTAGAWWCFEGLPLSITIQSGSALLNEVSADLQDNNETYNSPNFTITALSFVIANANPTQTKIIYSAKLKGITATSAIDISSTTAYIDGNGQLVVSLVNSTKYPSGYTIESIAGSISLEVILQISGQIATQTYDLTIDNENK